MKKIKNTVFLKVDLTLTATLVLILLLFMNFGGNYFWREVWFLFEIFVLTFFTRTVLYRTSVSTFLKGLYLGCALTFLANGFIQWIYPERDKSVFLNSFVVGFGEELFKFVPVLLLAWFLWRKHKAKLNPSDWLWLSVASGAAFSLAEKVLYRDVHFPFTYGPHLGSIPIFSDALGIYAHGEKFGFIGHAAATGFIGLMMGLGFILKNKTTLTKKFWWTLPLAGYVWVALEHAFNNAHYTSDSRFWSALGGGQITPTLFILALLGVLAADVWRLIFSFRQQNGIGTEVKLNLKRVRLAFGTSWWKGVQALWLFVCFWRCINFANCNKKEV